MLDDLIWGAVNSLLTDPNAIISEYTSRRNGTKSNDTVITKKRNEVKHSQQERSRVIDLFQSGIVEKNEIEPKLKKLQSKIEQPNDEINFLEREREESRKLMALVENMEDFAKAITKNLDTCNFEEKKKIVRFLIEEVEVDSEKERVHIKHIFPTKSQKYPLRSRAMRA